MTSLSFLTTNTYELSEHENRNINGLTKKSSWKGKGVILYSMDNVQHYIISKNHSGKLYIVYYQNEGTYYAIMPT